MSIFKLNLKTRNGNNVKEKEVFNIMFSINYYENSLTKESNGLYTFSISYGNKKSYKSDKIYKLKDPVKRCKNNDPKKEVIFKIIFNLLNIAAKISKQEDINPDIIILNSMEFNSQINKDYIKKLVDIFNESYSANKINSGKTFEGQNSSPILSIKKFCLLNNKTKFLIIDPLKDPDKYKKSLFICKELKNIIIQSLENEK